MLFFFASLPKTKGYAIIEQTKKFTGICGTNMEQGYSFVGNNSPETLSIE